MIKMKLDKLIMTLDKQQVKLLEEMCISVDYNDHIIGPKSKKECHLLDKINTGLLHRGFSVLLFDKSNKLLVTWRSNAKITFPGYITNTCCSHPLYNNLEMEENDTIGVKRAVQRRLRAELGIDVAIDKMQYMTRFLYKSSSNCRIWGENEIDYIVVIKLNKDISLNPNPNEVKDFIYVAEDNLLDFLSKAKLREERISPWFQLIIDKFLFTYWRNINNLKLVQDCHTIYNFYD